MNSMNAVIRRPALFNISYNILSCFSSMYGHRTFATISSITRAIADCHLWANVFISNISSYYFLLLFVMVLVMRLMFYAVRCGSIGVCQLEHSVRILSIICKFIKLATHTHTHTSFAATSSTPLRTASNNN